MTQQTLQEAGDCRTVLGILRRKDLPGKVNLEYEGDSQKKRLRYSAERKHAKSGWAMVHPQEIYASSEYGLSEQRTYVALNQLVAQGLAETHFSDGLIWYSLRK